jgi:hypothetical protein
MNKILKLRLANKSDIKSLAKTHLICGKLQPDGFMHQLGLGFLKTYYRILLNEKGSVIVIAEDENGIVHGFCSGSLAAEKHLDELKRNQIKLAFSLIPALIKSPKIIGKLLARNRFVKSAGQSTSFGISQGSRCEYWAWRPESRNLVISILMFETWLNIVFELGSASIKGEVDILNKYVLRIHKIIGAKVIDELILSDGRKRVIIEYTKKINK